VYRTLDDFLDVWKSERESTMKVFTALTDESLAQRVTGDGRSLGRIAWHVVSSIPEMLRTVGLPVEGPGDADPVPSIASEIVAAYDRSSRAVIMELSSAWNDASLLEERQMYGETWKNGFTLMVLLQHQTHHRGQMTVLMRQAGLLVPGVCGPSKEEWALYGMPVAE
jgi:uncharacterized damage-inducible protein DinB